MAESEFAACEICGARSWSVVRRGPIRDGAFGRLTGDDACIGRCQGCGAERLAEPFCYDDSVYASSEYRTLLAQGADADAFFAEHDILQLQHLSALWPTSARGQVVADIGSAAGSFLDHVSGLAKTTIAVEPCTDYHESLISRGHAVYSETDLALQDWGGKVDLAFSFSVIEHVRNPRAFLRQVGEMLRPGGRALISTPNRHDVLMALLPDDYPSFFYRTVHRWYFDISSLERCAESAGVRATDARCVHRFGLSNAMQWLRDRRPAGHRALENVGDDTLDSLWRGYLEGRWKGDYLYLWLTRGD